jgi:ribosomal protein L21E
MNFDFEGDRYNMTVGYEGRAAERLAQLETLEGPGNVVTLQDFTNGETVQGVIETITFQRMTPPERRFKGFGGIIYLTLRTI